MTTKHLKITLTALVLGLMASSASFAADAPVYGSQLMTNQERIEYRNKVRAAKTAEEREQIRLQHHEAMQLRAKEKGLTLPETPPARGTGKGQRMMSGDGKSGAGPAGGMGQGQNR